MAKIYWRNGWAWARATRKGVEYRESLGTRSARVAEERIQTWLAELSQSKWVKGSTPYETAVRKFTEAHLPILKKSSRKRYLLSLLTLGPHFEGKALQDIGRADLSEFVAARRKDGVTASTIRRDLACLSSVFTTAEDFELCDVNPVSSFMRQQKRRAKLTEAPPRKRYLSHKEELLILSRALEKLWAVKDRKKTRITKLMILAAIVLSIDLGLRDEELLRLMRDGVDLDRNEVTVRAEDAKNSKERQVPLLPRARLILTALPRHKEVDLVLWHRHGRGFYDLNHTLQALGASVGVTGIRWQDLRRTCGCRLLQDHKMPIERVSKWLGHSSIEQTQRTYAFLETEQLHGSIGAEPRDERSKRDLGALDFRTLPGTAHYDGLEIAA